MKKIGLLARPGDLLAAVLEELKKQIDYIPEIFNDPSQAALAAKHNRIQILIIVTVEFEESDISTIKVIKENLEEISLIVITHELKEEYRDRAVALDSFLCFDVVKDRKHIAPVIQRLVNNEKVVNRNSRRFDVNRAAIVIEVNGRKHETVIVDLSKTGAKLIIVNSSIIDGAKVKIKVKLSDESKDLFINGSVVWVRRIMSKDFEPDRQILGVEFDESLSLN